MIQERIYILLAKILSGEANSSEIDEFNSLIDSNHDWRSQHFNLDELWHALPETGFSDQQAEESYQKHALRLATIDQDFASGVYSNDWEEELAAPVETHTDTKPWYQQWSSLTLLFC